MAVRVWAFRVGNFVQDASSGWRYSIRFNLLNDLIDSLRDKDLGGQGETLAIVAHGDAVGVVQLDSNLISATLSDALTAFSV